jgi:hypothetical protein
MFFAGFKGRYLLMIIIKIEREPLFFYNLLDGVIFK